MISLMVYLVFLFNNQPYAFSVISVWKCSGVFIRRLGSGEDPFARGSILQSPAAFLTCINFGMYTCVGLVLKASLNPYHVPLVQPKN